MDDSATMKVEIGGRTVTCLVPYDELMDAIRAVSGNGYGLTPEIVADVCRFTGRRLTFEQATGADELARVCIETYWRHYGEIYRMRTGRLPEASWLVNIYRVGPTSKAVDAGCWKRVEAALLKKTEKREGRHA